MSAAPKVYSNGGNQAVIALIDGACQRLLDVGCGNGANAQLLTQSRPGIHIEGITHTPEEATLAGRWMEKCFIADIERGLPSELEGTFDTILFSHILEHLRSPEVVLATFLRYLKPSGQILIAVPNVVAWRTRLRFLKGDFQYEEFGIFDNTHLRFFTFRTAARYLLSQCADLASVQSTADGSVPLGPFRKLLPGNTCARLDFAGSKLCPNLFGGQILVDARVSDA